MSAGVADFTPTCKWRKIYTLTCHICAPLQWIADILQQGLSVTICPKIPLCFEDLRENKQDTLLHAQSIRSNHRTPLNFAIRPNKVCVDPKVASLILFEKWYFPSQSSSGSPPAEIPNEETNLGTWLQSSIPGSISISLSNEWVWHYPFPSLVLPTKRPTQEMQQQQHSYFSLLRVKGAK